MPPSPAYSSSHRVGSAYSWGLPEGDGDMANRSVLDEGREVRDPEQKDLGAGGLALDRHEGFEIEMERQVTLWIVLTDSIRMEIPRSRPPLMISPRLRPEDLERHLAAERFLFREVWTIPIPPRPRRRIRRNAPRGGARGSAPDREPRGRGPSRGTHRRLAPRRRWRAAFSQGSSREGSSRGRLSPQGPGHPTDGLGAAILHPDR